MLCKSIPWNRFSSFFILSRVENYTQLNMQLPKYLYKQTPPSSLSDGQNLNELTSLC